MTPASPITLFRAAAARDAAGLDCRPAFVAVAAGKILAAGPTQDVLRRLPNNQPIQTIDLPNSLILPALVNAHAHLDLTSLGPRPYQGHFPDWLRSVVRHGPETPDDVAHSVQLGLKRSIDQGVGYLADIARSPHAVTARQTAPLTLPGASFLECFGLGARQPQAWAQTTRQLDALLEQSNLPINTTNRPASNTTPALRIGLSPHAPYSAGPDLYLAAARLAARDNLPLTTHLAETLEEIEFTQHATGPLADLIRDLGKWDPTIQPTGLHPADWLADALSLAPGRWLLAHCNYVHQSHIALFAATQTSVVYCPVASDYFRHHPRGNNRSTATQYESSASNHVEPHPQTHPYRQMLQAGVNVCLGTDSILCQPPDEPQPMGIFPQMRHLYRRDTTDPAVLLTMATRNGLLALGLPPTLTDLTPGQPARLTAIDFNPTDPADPLTQALANDKPLHALNTR